MRPWYPSDRRDAPIGDPIVRAIRRGADGDEPDPQFRNRLRGAILSHHVAVREGHAMPVLRPAMTPIGRGVLVASVLLAVGVTGVGAASQQAIPDDPLYAVKLRIEALRILAAPPDLRDDLVAMSLEERLSEVETAVSRGRWHAAHEAALLVTQTEDELARLGGPPPAVADRIADHLASLTGLLAAVPAGRSDAAQDISAARAAIRAANDHAAAAAAGRGQGGGGGAGATGGNGGNGNGANGGNGNGANGKDSGGGTSSEPAPSPSPKPTSQGNGPKASPAAASPEPHPTPRASHAPQGSPAS
jgi:uncharacterized membrane protein YgcG